MNTKTIITSLGLMGLSCTAQAASSDPWNYYRMGGNYSSAYSTRYDSNFGMSIRGMYGFHSGNDYGIDMPDLYGAQLGLHANIPAGSVFHELSFNLGALTGSKTYEGELKWKQQVFPFTAGYSFNVPLSDSATFYLGGKIGLHYYKQELSGGVGKVSESDSSGTYSALIGFKFSTFYGFGQFKASRFHERAVESTAYCQRYDTFGAGFLEFLAGNPDTFQ